MKFTVMDSDSIRRVKLAIDDIRAGKMVILVDDEDRENEGDLTMAADAITPEAINFMATHGRGLICLSLTSDRVKHLQLPMMASNNQSPYHTAFTVSIEAREGVTTGISAADRSQTIKVAINPSTQAHDLVTPGHVFPLRARDGGVLVRTGQTEGSIDLSRLAGLTPAGVICEIMNDDGTMSRLPDLKTFGEKHQIRIVTVADLIQYRIRHEVLVESCIESTVQLGALGNFKIQVFRSTTDSRIHLSLSCGDISGDEPVLTRVQAARQAVDVFGFLTSDSAEQLERALQQISKEGRGVLLYMNISGTDSEETIHQLAEHLSVQLPNEKLQIKDGALRDMGSGAQILLKLGVRKLKLLTNNPRKIVGLEGFGLTVSERVPLEVPVSAENKSFLRARQLHLGHLLSNIEEND